MGNEAERPAGEVGAPTATARIARALLVGAGVAAWFGTQALIAARGFPEGIGDGIHQYLAPANAWLGTHAGATNLFLIVTSVFIDALGLFLLLSGILGRSIRPFLGLMVLFVLRQAAQALTALPSPAGMIWRYPGVPSLFVTYGTPNDFFFSGHTAIAVYGALELAQFRRRWLTIAGAVVAIVEATAVLALRAHYTMDVFTAALAAAWAADVADRFASRCDRALARLGGRRSDRS